MLYCTLKSEGGQSMILVITKTNDLTADYVINKMIKRKIKNFRLNSDDFCYNNFALQFSITKNNYPSSLILSSKNIAIDEIKSVWLRRIVTPDISNFNIVNDDARNFAIQEYDFSLRWLINFFDCLVVDREENLIKARNKFLQLKIAQKVGFIIPSTLITNDSEQAREFVAAHEKSIVKSIGGYGKRLANGFESAYSNIITPRIVAQFDSLKLAPVCLQEYIDKKFELRVTIIKDRIFTCKIDSQNQAETKVDWRKGGGNLKHTVYVLDSIVSGKLIQMMQFFQINFAAFDLVVTPKDEIVFLEMNPSGQFVWIEELTGMPITDTLIDFLIGKI